MQRSYIEKDQQSSSMIEALKKAERACIRVVENRIQNHLFKICGPGGQKENKNIWTWHVLVVDHGKKEEFLERSKTGGLDIKDYGNILLSDFGKAVPEEVCKKVEVLVKRFEDDFVLVRLQKNKFAEIYYVLSNPGKKQEIMRATSFQEIKQHGKILYCTKHEDPPEALSIEIMKGQLVDSKFIISDVNFNLMHDGIDIINGWTLLHFKAYNGDMPSSSDIININAQDKICGRKPVHIAAREGHIDVVEFFLNNSASVNETDNSGWTLLHYAAWKGNVALVKLIIQNNPDVKAKDKCMGKEPIHVAAERGHVEVIQILLDNGAGVDDDDGSGRTPLYYSVWEGCLEAAKCLVSRGANVNKANRFSNKPIHIAAEVDNKEMIQLLLSKGAGIEDKDKFGKTVLHLSASCGILNNVRYLVENGANLNAVDNEGKTPLALGKKHTEVATYLAGKMQSMCIALYNQHQYSKSLGILKDIYDNSGLDCEHLHSLRTKCLLGLSITDAGASYDEAAEVLRDAFQMQDTPGTPNQSVANSISESIFTRGNCYMMFCFVTLAFIFRFLISFFEPGAPI